MKNNALGGLDRFRLIAAFLVVAIHTSPLGSFHDGADFFFTRILARTAVPFFFMVTGCFVLSDTAKIRNYLKRLCILYGIAVLLYLPLGIYAGHYQALTLGGFFRMLFFDGTFYHLWYFPACILGVLLVTFLRRFFNLKTVTLLTALLYITGLFGDSYFGIADKLPLLHRFYEGLFQISSHTRNGLFFAPLFLVLGIWMREARPKLTQPFRLVLLALCFCAMTAEGFLLRYFRLQRHDSMYLFLVPVMLLLYRCLLSVPSAPAKNLRRISTFIYILHPALIVAVRGVGRALHLTGLLVDNSLIHYLTVSLLSLFAGLLLTRFRPHVSSFDTGRAWIELNMSALKHNVEFLRSLVPDGCRLMPAVKADAYGHGAVMIAKELNRLGIRDFCVACAAEGIQLRKAGVRGQILILGYTHPSQFPLLHRYRLTQTVVDYSYAQRLAQCPFKLHVHLAVDTGMHRLGIPAESVEHLEAVYKMKNLSVDGIYTHLSACDSLEAECKSFTEKQIARFYETIHLLKSMGCPCKGLHLLSSYGILNYPQAAENYVRPGILLYGTLSSGKGNPYTALKPVLALKTRIASVRTLLPGEAAGYGLEYIADRETSIAVLTIGYADGLPRELSHCGGEVLINGVRAPIIGRICMDQTLVDVSEIPNVFPGNTAVIIGNSGTQSITSGDLAEQCGTITNEILSRMGARLKRISIK